MLDLVIYKLKRPYHWLKTGVFQALPAQIKNGFPQRGLKLIFITGTDGKTTSSFLLHQVLKEAGIKAGLISTVGAYVGSKEMSTGLHVTSPQPARLYSILADMKSAGCTHVILEVTSHGYYQYRTFGLKPAWAGVTNVSHEHLDYHVNLKEYQQAKLEAVEPAQEIVLNQDTPSFSFFARRLPDKKMVVFSSKSTLPIKVKQSIQKRFSEPFNQTNARFVFALAKSMAIDDDQVAKGIENFKGVPGRMEEILNNRKFRVIVDFAHTPQALDASLQAIRLELKQQTMPGRLIAVYGAAGLRDTSKRPLMGQVGTELADLVVLTAEDPRTEDVWAIIRQMKEQLTKKHQKIVSIADRKEAIDFALNQLAKPGDVVGIFGKGPEQSLCLGTVEYPWDDRQVVREVLGEK